jgi:hypothetical protein
MTRLEEGQQSANELSENLTGFVDRLRLIESALSELPFAALRTVMPSVVLQPGLLRDRGNSVTVSIPDSAELVKIALEIRIDEYSGYEAELHDSSTDTIWSRSKLKADSTDQNAYVNLILAAQILVPGEYFVVLKGEISDGQYRRIDNYGFRVTNDSNR